MKKVTLYCISLNPDHYNKINSLGYIPVGLGEKLFSKKWMTDKGGSSISEKNKHYGEYTFHYWLWKNYLENLEDGWIGFCQYRKFWSTFSYNPEIKSMENLKKFSLAHVPDSLSEFESILGTPYYINQFRFSKFLKKNFKTMLLNPSLIFNKNKRNIKFHFDMWHGKDNLDKAIDILDIKDRSDFRNFVQKNVSFNPHNMFICKSKNILNNYYSSVFPWLFECEKKFSKIELKGYGLQRIYGFLAERYMSFWFQKYTKSTNLSIMFKDITYLD